MNPVADQPIGCRMHQFHEVQSEPTVSSKVQLNGFVERLIRCRTTSLPILIGMILQKVYDTSGRAGSSEGVLKYWPVYFWSGCYTINPGLAIFVANFVIKFPVRTFSRKSPDLLDWIVGLPAVDALYSGNLPVRTYTRYLS